MTGVFHLEEVLLLCVLVTVTVTLKMERSLCYYY